MAAVLLIVIMLTTISMAFGKGEYTQATLDLLVVIAIAVVVWYVNLFAFYAAYCRAATGWAR